MTPMLSLILGATLWTVPAQRQEIRPQPMFVTAPCKMEMRAEENDAESYRYKFSFDTGIHTGVYPSMVRVLDADGKVVTHLRFDTGDELLIPAGTYDFIYEFGSTSNLMLGAVIVKEDVAVDSDAELTISLDDAKNELKVENYDRDGNIMLPPIYADGVQITQGTISGARFDLFLSLAGDSPACVLDAGYIYSNAMNSPVVMISDVSDRYAVTFDTFSVVNGGDGGKEQLYYYDKYTFTDGLSASQTLTNKEIGYIYQQVRYSPSELADRICLDGQAIYGLDGEEGMGISSMGVNLSPDAVAGLYLNCPHSSAPGVVNTRFATAMCDNYVEIDGYVYLNEQLTGQAQYVTENGDIESDLAAFPIQAVDNVLKISDCPYVFTGMEICRDWMGVPMNLFSGREGQVGYLDFSYKVKKDGELLGEGNNRGELYMFFLYNLMPPFSAGDYTVEINKSDTSYGSEAVLAFDLGRDDPTPPDFRLLQIQADGVPGMSFLNTQTPRIRVMAGDWNLGVDYSTYEVIKEYAGNPEVDVEVSPCGMNEWRSLSVNILDEYFNQDEGAVYETEAMTGLEKGSYDIRLTATDGASNSNVQVLRDAFEITDNAAVNDISAAPRVTLDGNILTLSDSGMAKVSVTDVAGHLLMDTTVSGATSVRLPVDGLQAGIYVVTVTVDGVQIFAAKIVK